MAEDKRQKQQEAADLVGKYAGGWFVTSPDDDVFHSPYSWRPTPVRIDWGVYNTDSPEWKQYMASYDYNRKYKVRDSNKKQFVPKWKVTNPNAQQTQWVTNQWTVNTDEKRQVVPFHKILRTLRKIKMGQV